MSAFYIISQVLAGFSLTFNVISRYFKKQSHSLLFNIISNLFGLASCAFLTAYMGMVGLFAATIRSYVFYIYSKKNWEKQVWLLLLFIAAQLALCIATGFISGFIWWDFTLVMVKSTFFAYGCWQHNVKVFRICSIISCALTIVYFILYKGYVNCIAEFLSIIVLVYAMIRDRKKSRTITLEENVAADQPTENTEIKD